MVGWDRENENHEVGIEWRKLFEECFGPSNVFYVDLLAIDPTLRCDPFRDPAKVREVTGQYYFDVIWIHSTVVNLDMQRWPSSSTDFSASPKRLAARIRSLDNIFGLLKDGGEMISQRVQNTGFSVYWPAQSDFRARHSKE